MRGFQKLIYVAVTVALIGCLSGCNVNFGFKTNYVYQNGEKYTAGDREITEKIETIDIDYLSGDVMLIGTDSDVVTVKETSVKQLDDKRKVHTWVDGTTLYVRYCASAKGLDLNNLNKKLEIEIPADCQLEKLKVDVSSGDFTGKEFEANGVMVYASSGDVEVTCGAKDIELKTSSGDITLNQHGESDSIKLHASSGHVTANVETAGKFDGDVSSGKIMIQGHFIKELESDVSSGEGEYRFDVTPEKSRIHHSSGRVTIFLPENADLTGEFHLSSGKLSYDLAFAKNGDRYVCGNGANQMKVDVSSGNVDVKAIDAN